MSHTNTSFCLFFSPRYIWYHNTIIHIKVQYSDIIKFLFKLSILLHLFGFSAKFLHSIIKMLVFPHHRAIIVSWKYSSAGMSVRLTRERSWVRAPLLPFFVPFFSLRFHFIFLSSPKACFFQPPDFSLAALFVSAALSSGWKLSILRFS